MQCGSEASEHTVNVPGMSMAVLCAKFASMIKWHRTSLRGGHFGCHLLFNKEMGVF